MRPVFMPTLCSLPKWRPCSIFMHLSATTVRPAGGGGVGELELLQTTGRLRRR